MKTKPILFNTEMVRAILAGRKTVTRRVVKPQPPDNDPHNVCFNYIENGIAHFGMRNRTPHLVKLPYRPGDILYVREAFQQNYDGSYSYRAGHKFEKEGGWRPSIHMPEEAARIFLRVTDVRVERLQEIAFDEVLDEGLAADLKAEDVLIGTKKRFAKLWDSIIKPKDRALYGWEANPWVFVVLFERISKVVWVNIAQEENYGYRKYLY